jgi:hypothetical protein
VIVGPRGTKDGVPAVYSDWAGAPLSDITVTGAGTPTAVYVSRYDARGILVQASFPPRALPAGQPLHVRLAGARAELVARGGGVVAVVATTRERLSRIRVIAPPRDIRVRAHGRAAIVTWRGERRVRWTVTTGRTRAAGQGRLAASVDVRSSPDGRYRARVMLGRGERWISVYGYVTTARGWAVTVPIPGVDPAPG